MAKPKRRFITDVEVEETVKAKVGQFTEGSGAGRHFIDEAGDGTGVWTEVLTAELPTEELPTEELPTEELDLSEYATIVYVDSRTVIFQFNDTTDWVTMSGGFYVEFNHNLNAPVSSEISRSGEKLLANTTQVDLNNLRIIVPYDYRFSGQIKINK